MSHSRQRTVAMYHTRILDSSRSFESGRNLFMCVESCTERLMLPVVVALDVILVVVLFIIVVLPAHPFLTVVSIFVVVAIITIINHVVVVFAWIEVFIFPLVGA